MQVRERLLRKYVLESSKIVETLRYTSPFNNLKGKKYFFWDLLVILIPMYVYMDIVVVDTDK